MLLWHPSVGTVGSGLDDWLASLPSRPAVYLLHTSSGQSLAGRTSVLGRRLARLLGARAKTVRLLNLRDIVTRVETQYAASWLETNLVHYSLMRSLHAGDYRTRMRLRLPPYLKVGLTNAFPRCYISTRLSRTTGFWYGPFRNRAAAEQFQKQVQDLYQIRRCQEDLAPSRDHPGCIYGEMNLCLRPCQAVVGRDEYASEVARLTTLLSDGGQSTIAALMHQRDRLSEELRFEEARQLHQRLEKVHQALHARDELARETGRLNGVAVTRSIEDGAVELRFVLGGAWLTPVRLRVGASGDRSVSMDERLRRIAAGLTTPALAVREREDHMALLARWYYSTFRDGEWLPFERMEALPYRRLVRAISRVASDAASSSPAGTPRRPATIEGARETR